MTDSPENVKIKMEVMDRVEDGRADLLALEKVAEVGPGEVPAGVAAAGLVKRPPVAGVLEVFDGHPTPAREEGPVSRVPGGEDAIEEIDPPLHSFEDVLYIAHPHEIAGLVPGEKGVSVFQDFEELSLGLPDAQASVRVA